MKRIIIPSIGLFALTLGVYRLTHEWGATPVSDVLVKPVTSQEIEKRCPVYAEDHAIGKAIREASQKYSLDHQLLTAIMFVESSCKTKARSGKGAVGLMQLMPSTAEWLGVKNVHSPRENIMGGAKYMSYLLKKFDGDVELALAAYNSGPVAVRKHESRVPPYKETRRYLMKVMSAYQALQSNGDRA
jgi:soluble lytic murein transglycosylase-like protein